MPSRWNSRWNRVQRSCLAAKTIQVQNAAMIPPLAENRESRCFKRRGKIPRNGVVHSAAKLQHGKGGSMSALGNRHDEWSPLPSAQRTGESLVDGRLHALGSGRSHDQQLQAGPPVMQAMAEIGSWQGSGCGSSTRLVVGPHTHAFGVDVAAASPPETLPQ